MTIGDRVKLMRKKNNITIEALAKELDITGSAISQLENGKTYPRTDVLQKLCSFFKVSADYIIFGKEFSENITIEKEEPVEKEEVNLAILNTLVRLVNETVSSKNEVIETKNEVINLQDRFKIEIVNEKDEYIKLQKEYISMLRK